MYVHNSTGESWRSCLASSLIVGCTFNLKTAGSYNGYGVGSVYYIIDMSFVCIVLCGLVIKGEAAPSQGETYLY